MKYLTTILLVGGVSCITLALQDNNIILALIGGISLGFYNIIQ